MLLLRVRPEGPCLPRALTLYAALRREGFSAVLVTGVRRQGAELLSHAWVELWGEPLEDAYQTEDLSVYKENYRHPREG